MLKHIPFYAILLGKPLGNKKSVNGDVLVYGAIEAHDFGPKGCIASNKTIAGETGLKEGSVANIISRLSQAKWILVELNSGGQRIGIKPIVISVNGSSGDEG